LAEELQTTTVSKAYVDNILESMSEVLVVTSPTLDIQLVNRAGQEQLGYKNQELIGKPLAMLFADPILGAGTNPSQVNVLGVHERLLRTKQGQRILAHWAGSEMRDSAGVLQGVVCAALNITERKLAEQRLRASLDEKEVLLKEVHHRVKNNLQIISSLLALQARETADPDAHRMFEDSQGRIRSMALIHEQLYQSGELSRIDFSEYVQRLCSHLADSSGVLNGRAVLRIDVAPTPLPLFLAIPCGMILNELVSNALKHAFPEDRQGQIFVGFDIEGESYRLTVRDNGVGIAGRSSTPNTGSLGLKVVEALVGQLGGSLTCQNSGGASFTITFDIPAEPTQPVEDVEAGASA
jgi:PAS domain S-box-containing protein